MVAPTVRLCAGPFDAAREEALLLQGRTDIGALVCFTGLCRDEAGTLAALELEHYPGMAESEIAAIAADALARSFARAKRSCWSPPPPAIAARPSRRPSF